MDKAARTDNAKANRVELHCITKMNAMDGIASASQLIKHASAWGHKAIAIVDQGVVQAFPEACLAARETGMIALYGMEAFILNNDASSSGIFHLTLLAKNQIGLKNLYRLVSLSHTEYLHKRTPLLPKNILNDHREGLLIGSACEAGELQTAIRDTLPGERLETIADYYDFLEMQPHVTESVSRKIVQLGEKLSKPVVAVGDVRFIEPSDEAAWRALKSATKCSYAESKQKFYFMTTEEMLADFAYLGTEKAFEVVVTNSNLIADMIEDIQPIPTGLFLTSIDGADEELASLCSVRLRELYGETPPDSIKTRLNAELDSIRVNGFASIYLIVRRIVEKSLDDGHCVGTRGMAGSSFVAYLLGITDIDPIKHNLRFEIFAGLNSEKPPSFMLNFSREYQPVILTYAKELLGKDRVVTAGFISTIKEKTAASYANKYFEDKNTIPGQPEFERLADQLVGTKRTIGGFSGGCVLIPDGYEAYDFTPIQYSGNDANRSERITHFDYNDLRETLMKINLMAHDTPMLLEKLCDLTGAEFQLIRFDDETTLKLLVTADTLGIPEFETEFMRTLIKSAKPKTFDDLVKIQGLSHGAGVWLGNADGLINSGTANLSEVIALRDDIMAYLIGKGINRETAYEIMERVRKGNGLGDSHQELMASVHIPEWYIESCNKIGYLSPKAHALSYTMMAYRVAWFKAHHLAAFYKVYFEVVNHFPSPDYLSLDIHETKRQIAEIEADTDASAFHKKDRLSLLEIRLEMIERGI